MKPYDNPFRNSSMPCRACKLEAELGTEEVPHPIDARVHSCVDTSQLRDLPRGAQVLLRPPIDMILFCPKCHKQHLDAPNTDKNWTNPPHRSHECQFCGYIWRPADVATNGVTAIATRGERDDS